MKEQKHFSQSFTLNSIFYFSFHNSLPNVSQQKVKSLLSNILKYCILSCCLINLHARYIMRNAGLYESQAGIKTARRNINNLRYADNTILLWCWRTLESPLDCKEIQPVHPTKGDQSWVFTGRTDAETETPVLWPSDAKTWLIGKDPDAGRDWGQEEKGTTEDEMAEWHHQLDGQEFE